MSEPSTDPTPNGHQALTAQHTATSTEQIRASHVLRNLCYLPAALQGALVSVLVLSEFGFDHPGPSGLDIGDALAMAATYALSLLLGVIISIKLRSWGALLLQALLFLVAAGIVRAS